MRALRRALPEVNIVGVREAAYELVIDGESYRSRFKPNLDQPAEFRPRQRKRA